MLFRSLVTAAIVTLVAAGPCTRQYTVKDGDICDKISASQNVSTYQLATINKGIINDQCSNLTPKQTICLGYQGEDCNAVYVVVKGDTCDKIASAYSLNTTILYENNPQIDSQCHNIYIGQVLCVSGSVQVPPRSGNQQMPIPSTATPANPANTPPPSSTPKPNPATTPVPSSSPPPSSNPSPASDNDDGDDDDSDLPYCDEL